MTVDPIQTLVTDRADAPSDGTIVSTPGQRPDLVIKLMTPIAQVLVRAARTYVQGLIGFLVLGVAAKPLAEGLGVVIPPGDFWAAFQVAAGLATAPTVISLLQNVAELLGRVDALFPQFRA